MKKLFTLLFLATAAFAGDPRIEKIERGLVPSVLIEGGPTWTVEERMRFYNVPGLSVAVIDGGKIVWAKGYGLADVRANRKVTPRTLFLAGSISKPVAAVAAVDLVERGVVPFDADVNTLLKSWQLPANEFTAKTPVSLRLLLSHSAGTTVHGFPGYPRAFPRPTIRQILDGQAPANTAPVRVDLAPNTQFRYSGGGTTVAQQALADVTGLDFASLMRRHVLAPLGMNDSTYAQPLPSALHARAATAYRPGMRAIPGGWHVYPEAAAAGLWTTPSDLAKVIVEMHDALAGRDAKVLTIDGARMMLTPRFVSGGTGRHVGIGWFVEDRNGAKYFGHDGVDEGFDAMLFATGDGSKGAVIMANTNGSFSLILELLRAIAREYEWPNYLTVAPPPQRTPDELLARAPGRYRVNPDRVIPIRRNGDRLEAITLSLGPVPLYYLADGTLARWDSTERYRLTDAGLEILADGKTTPAPRTEDPLTHVELLSAGRIDDALAALRATPNAQMTNRVGSTLLRLGRIDDAIRFFELNTELDPESANAWDSLSDALLQAGRFDRAEEAVRKAIRYVDSEPMDERTRGFLRANTKIKLHEIENRDR
jgi:CubicO group peptidase (beta-lactamase class C family)